MCKINHDSINPQFIYMIFIYSQSFKKKPCDRNNSLVIWSPEL